MRVLGSVVLVSLSAAVFACSSDSKEGPPPSLGDPEDFRSPPSSCALDCPTAGDCEPDGYQCPSLADWDKLPHAEACGKWDGKFPTPVAGKCNATLPTGAAAKQTGVDPTDPGTTILPTGYRAKPAGKTIALGDTQGSFTSNVLTIAGTDLAVVIDTGIKDHAVRLIDTKAIETAPATAIKSLVRYGSNENLTHGGVIVAGASTTTRRLYVGGGYSGEARLYAFDIDLTATTLKANTAENVPIPLAGANKTMPSGMAARPDGKIAVGTQNNSGSSPVLLVDPKTKTVEKTIAVAKRDVFTVFINPADTAGRYAFASSWDGDRVDVLDLDAGSVLQSIPVGKAPQAFVALDARYIALVSSDADEISVFDTLPTMWSLVSRTKIVEGSGYGWAPSGVTYDSAAKRLYVSLAGLNAVAAYDVVLSGTAPPALSMHGMVGTEWWPTAVALRSDGALVVVNGKGSGTGANPIAFKPSDGNITSLTKGSVQLVPAGDLAASAKGGVDALTDLGKLEGAPKVECGGAAYDFPIPATNTEGPSKVIKKIVFAIKENKTFDAVFGDVPGVDGDPKLVMAPGQMDAIFANERKIAKEFTNFDNYYTSAEQSIQGHIWTAYGRITEFSERNWLLAWGRGIRLPTMGIAQGKPVEGSLFDWFVREKVDYDNMGELTGASDLKKPASDPQYPGMFYAQGLPDTVKACYIAARSRVVCDLKQFTYAVMPNDHTAGGSAGQATVETFIAVGDEGTGQLVEALSKSPDWPHTLVVITMDDPQDGGDHVDAHRTPLMFAGPWVKRGYVSKGHYDTSSLHKLFAHIYGVNYPSEIVARAALPLDAFTSTPDYTPYQHAKRTVKTACNSKGTPASTTAAMSNWDFSMPDQAPGIGRQVWELLHNGAPPPEGYGDDDDDD